MYKSYNRLYKKGRAVSRPFIYTSGKTRPIVKKKTLSANRHYNKYGRKSGYSVRLVKIVKR
jgi:hypothetical protein